MKSLDELTKQETAILTLVAKGWQNAKIAHELLITTKTVETHLSHIFDKLGVSSRTQAAIHAFQYELVPIAEMSGITDDSKNDNAYPGA